MQNTHYINAIIAGNIENEVMAGWQHPISGSDFAVIHADFRKLQREFHRLIQPVDVTVGCCQSMFVKRIVPYTVNFHAGAGRDIDEAFHAALRCFACISLRKLSLSHRVGGPLFSPSISA